MSADFDGAKNLLEFRESEQQELFMVQRSKGLYKIKDYENLVKVCKTLRQKIPAFRPKLVICNNGSVQNWANTVWSIGAFFEFQYKYNVCVLSEVQYFSHFLKSGEMTEDTMTIGSGRQIKIFKTAANVTILSFSELRRIRNSCETLQEFEDIYQKITEYFQMMIIGVKNRIANLKREDIHKVVFLNSNSVSYTLKMNSSTHSEFNSIRNYFKRFDLKESGVFLE